MQWYKLILIACLIAVIPHCTYGQTNISNFVQPSAPTLECLAKASENFGIPVPVILAIAKTEGGKVGEESINTNGSYDLGPMQINDRVWVPVMAQLTSGNQQLARNILRYHGCANLIFGTWIIKQHLIETGNMATAVGWYHSRTPVHMNRYQEKVRQNLMFLLSRLKGSS